MSFCTLGRNDVLLLLHPSLQCHLLLQKLLDLLCHCLQLRILVNTFVAASCLACHYFTLFKEVGSKKKVYFHLWSHGGRHHVWCQLGRRVFTSLFLLDKIHCQCKLFWIQFSLLTHIAKVPNVSKDILRKASLQEHILDLHPRDEPIFVIVRLLEKCLVPEQRKDNRTSSGKKDIRTGPKQLFSYTVWKKL